MQRAFILTLDVADSSPNSLAGEAANIDEDLRADGYSVISVIPYSQEAKAAGSLLAGSLGGGMNVPTVKQQL